MKPHDVDVTAILVNYNTRDLLRPCLDALRRGAEGLSLQVVIVDNASRDGSADVLRREFAGECELIFNATNVGFGRANNQALDRVRGRHVLLLNTDAFVPDGGVTDTVRFLDAHPEVGLLGVRLVGRDGCLQPSCRYFPTPWNEFLVQTGLARWFPRIRLVDDLGWDHASPRQCDWVPGCYYLVRASVVEQVGLFDPRFFLYYEEVDHCRAVKAAGWQVVFYPDTTVVHIGGESAKSESEITAAGRQISALQIESGLLYHRKHHGWAGLCAALVLSSIGDAWLAVKWLLKRGSLRGAGAYWAHAALTWSLLRRTGGGPPAHALKAAPTMFEHLRDDLRAYGGDWGAQGFWAMVVYRFGRWRVALRPMWLRKALFPLYRLLYKGVQVAAGIELPCEVEVGRNFVIDHFGGVVVSGYARFGDDCRLRTGVVVGLARTDDPCAPTIGNNVDIGTGAKVLGRIRIGNNVLIGANAVVTRDVPDDSVAVGVPAVVRPRRRDASPLQPEKPA